MDQDDSMLSSPSSAEDETFDEDNMFPTSTTNATSSHTGHSYVQAQTPQNDHLNAAAPGELSPPRSQTQGTTPHPANNTMNNGAVDDDEGLDMQPGSSVGAGQATQTTQTTEETKPGAGWKNRKAQDEMQRAWDHVVDKDFSLREFGDVMAHRQH